MNEYEDEELWELFVRALQQGKIKVILQDNTITKDINDVVKDIVPKDEE